METIIYILRHGQSVTNESGVFSGSNEVDLSPLGEKQAEKASEYLIDMGIDFIYSSPLSRAVNTALPLAKKLGKQIEIEKDFREICFGSWEGKTKNYLEENEENFNLSRSVIEGGIESSYEENQPDEHAAALLDTVKHISYMSDEEFLDLEDENERAAYLQQQSVCRKGVAVDTTPGLRQLSA